MPSFFHVPRPEPRGAEELWSTDRVGPETIPGLTAWDVPQWGGESYGFYWDPLLKIWKNLAEECWIIHNHPIIIPISSIFGWYKSTGRQTKGQPWVESRDPPEKLEMCRKMGVQVEMDGNGWKWMEMATGWFCEVPLHSWECMAMAQNLILFGSRNERAGSTRKKCSTKSCWSNMKYFWAISCHIHTIWVHKTRVAFRCRPFFEGIELNFQIYDWVGLVSNHKWLVIVLIPFHQIIQCGSLGSLMRGLVRVHVTNPAQVTYVRNGWK